ncbi:unnamed protein product [Dibothriocephalus latus]|uniref:Uncharacterized protein n=1 Tax=Dibothriocephalus latus TaxID=60516 RepID=A0A3P7MV49_DIBLA|nr:unnamed protein product [Dibothriocephalus latus]
MVRNVRNVENAAISIMSQRTMEELCADLKLQLQLMETLTTKLSTSSTGQSSSAGGSQYIHYIASSISKFLYGPQAECGHNS